MSSERERERERRENWRKLGSEHGYALSLPESSMTAIQCVVDSSESRLMRRKTLDMEDGDERHRPMFTHLSRAAVVMRHGEMRTTGWDV